MLAVLRAPATGGQGSLCGRGWSLRKPIGTKLSGGVAGAGGTPEAPVEQTATMHSKGLCMTEQHNLYEEPCRNLHQ